MYVVINDVLPLSACRRGDVQTVTLYMCNSCDIYRSWVKCSVVEV